MRENWRKQVQMKRKITREEFEHVIRVFQILAGVAGAIIFIAVIVGTGGNFFAGLGVALVICVPSYLIATNFAEEQYKKGNLYKK